MKAMAQLQQYGSNFGRIKSNITGNKSVKQRIDSLLVEGSKVGETIFILCIASDTISSTLERR
jgi:hypothetical protein